MIPKPCEPITVEAARDMSLWAEHVPELVAPAPQSWGSASCIGSASTPAGSVGTGGTASTNSGE